MSNHIEAFVAFDTSKMRNSVAIAEAGRSGEVRFLGEIDNTGAATAKLVGKLAAKYGRLTFCYEAGPTGYGLYRQIKSLGPECVVVAPSLIPKKPGDRVKTNRRDALSLVKLLRAGELPAVWVPDPRHEPLRDRGAGRLGRALQRGAGAALDGADPAHLSRLRLAQLDPGGAVGIHVLDPDDAAAAGRADVSTDAGRARQGDAGVGEVREAVSASKTASSGVISLKLASPSMAVLGNH